MERNLEQTGLWPQQRPCTFIGGGGLHEQNMQVRYFPLNVLNIFKESVSNWEILKKNCELLNKVKTP